MLATTSAPARLTNPGTRPPGIAGIRPAEGRSHSAKPAHLRFLLTLLKKPKTIRAPRDLYLREERKLQEATALALLLGRPMLMLTDFSEEAGGCVSSFLTFRERGRLSLANKQLQTESWGLMKGNGYCSDGRSAYDAAQFMLKVATSELSPRRMSCHDLSCPGGYGALTGIDGYSRLWELMTSGGMEKRLQSWFVEETKEYDIEKARNDIESDSFGEDARGVYRNRWPQEDKDGLLLVLTKGNALLLQLHAACDCLKDLKSRGCPEPDLYDYLVNELGVSKRYVNRFGKYRRSNAVFPSSYAIKCVPSSSYKPKPVVFRECVECKKIASDISYFKCPSRSCYYTHLGKCGTCAPTNKCSTCGESGCRCCFDSCALCDNKMCNCCDFHQRKLSERGGAPGCAWVVVKEKDYYDSSDDEDDRSSAGDSERADDKQYCEKCKPDGAKRFEVGVGKENVTGLGQASKPLKSPFAEVSLTGSQILETMLEVVNMSSKGIVWGRRARAEASEEAGGLNSLGDHGETDVMAQKDDPPSG
ncbi:hypothetical protein THAOC_07834 [Thalassiosira oceanica]|uniref:Uncharacterized protein n=1 Tax=Thalassiosira oceanica TaxID=159749 RepID=K0T0R6_THAOC|nr:hypothetical protein THAOC_07834 [Thalassiosira oceanica]|eukprot:EJK70779.1 hypothetical protein THAOC_07834 [Thalassiosira oceanica]